MYTRRDQVAVPQAGTNRWISTHAEFETWYRRATGILWIQGKPGSGKSVLAKSIISSRSLERTFLLASWFYSRRGGSVGTSHGSMMRSIAHQLLKQSRGLFDMFAPILRKSEFGSDTFQQLLQLPLQDTICVLDGLDESVSRDSEGKVMLQLLTDATSYPGSRLKVIILSRPYRAIRQVHGVYDILMEAENKADIEAVVKEGLHTLINTIGSEDLDIKLPTDSDGASNPSQSYAPGFPKSFLEHNQTSQMMELANIRQYLINNAQGVMLWVALCINYAIRHAERSLYTWSEIRRIVEGLPKELDDVYRTILSELPAASDADELAKARRILSWIVVAGSSRPLRLKELLDIVSIPDEWHNTVATTGPTCPVRALRPVFVSWAGFARSIVYLCGPLVEFLNMGGRSAEGRSHGEDISASSVVQLLHQTAKDFLEEGSNHIFTLLPGEALKSVEEDSRAYIHRVLPLQPAQYCPVLDDVNDDWKSSINSTVNYLEDKFLLGFILSSRLISLTNYLEAASDPDEGNWAFRKFFFDVKYWDTEIPGTAKKSMVGRCFWLACTLSMDTAVENLLYLTSLKSGWWVYHREIVFAAAALAAEDHRLRGLLRASLATQLAMGYVQPALTRNSFQDSPNRILRHEDRRRISLAPPPMSSTSSRRRSLQPSSPAPPRPPASPPPINGATKSAVAFTICQILHYLEGHVQPLDTMSAKRLGDEAQCRCTAILQDEAGNRVSIT